jgi:hypothetical protein
MRQSSSLRGNGQPDRLPDRLRSDRDIVARVVCILLCLERSWGILARRYPPSSAGCSGSGSGGAEKKLPLAQDPLPGSSWLGSGIVALFSEKPI